LSWNTGVDYYNFLREITSWKLLQNPIQLGGPGKEVQIDESLLVKAKYFRGHNIARQDQWENTFGGVTLQGEINGCLARMM
jgi:hypothetical protein